MVETTVRSASMAKGRGRPRRVKPVTGGVHGRTLRHLKAWVDESAGGWDEGAFWGRGKLGLVLTLRSPPRRLDELCDGGRPRRVVPPPPRHGDSNPDL